MSGLTIAIDGPAASGKGTLARRLARHFDLAHLDTGLLYRAVAAAMLSAGTDLDDEQAAVDTARRLDPSVLDRDRLADHAIGEAASRVAAMPGVRAELVTVQRRFARHGAVLDGRDIGTVILPDADVKLFVEADSRVRARRRAEEMRTRGLAADESVVLDDLRRRDARDAERADAPLKKAVDAILLDTSEMDIETAFRKAVDIVESAMGASKV